MVTSIVSFITVPVLEVGRFVIWWYGAGLKNIFHWAWQELAELEDHIHWKQWACALFIPMYGQNDWRGRMVSVVMRFVVLVYKTLWVLVWIVFHAIILGTYIVFPVLAIGMSVRSLYE